MHFFYIDEAGCTGRDLNNLEQPIFVAGGIIIRDEGWNETNLEFWEIISEYFEGKPPNNFELHACDLFSPNGEGFFFGHDREKRNELANNILALIQNRSHQISYIAVDKTRLREYNTDTVDSKDYLDLKIPYLVSFDYLLTLYDWFTKNHLGRSARALIILDEKKIYENEISEITFFRRYSGPIKNRVKHITEFSYAVNSTKNSMIQISDLVCFLVKKYLEIESGYKEKFSSDIKNIFRDFYFQIEERLIKKNLLESPEDSLLYNQFISSITVKPSKNWRTKIY